ncbi:MAG TPA: hypothetical protein VM582_01405, partial [Candidatus Thermoplasmatota archaeon]|nr:hypothetical protein [Candidatus Thermoplasmatota archaeon]
MHRWLDRAIIALAFASVLVFTLHVTGVLGGLALTALDVAVVAAYAVIFLLKGLLDERPARWFARHIWLAVALLPLTVPVLVAQPYFLVVQIVILLARAAKAIDRALHLHVVAGHSERYRARLAEEVSQPLLMNLANALEEAVVGRDFAGALGRSLHERRDLVEAAVRHGIESNPRLARVARFGPVQRWVDETTADVVDAAHAALASPQTNILLQEAFRDAFRE